MIRLGQKIRDLVTQIEGIAVSRVEYLNGCVQYGLKPVSKDGKMTETHYIDIDQLEVVDDGITVKPKQTGGDQPDAPRGFGLSSY